MGKIPDGPRRDEYYQGAKTDVSIPSNAHPRSIQGFMARKRSLNGRLRLATN